LTELVEEAAAEPVLAAFSTRDGEELSLDAVATSFEGEHATVFIVGMSDDLHQSRGGAKLADFEFQSVDTRIHGKLKAVGR
jgi:hypothetical protein